MRLVAKVFKQKAGIDNTETFSPVVRHSTIRLFIALSAKYNLNKTYLNVTTAFLNGHLNDDAYVYLPGNLECHDRGSKVLKPKTAIWGLKQLKPTRYKRVDNCLQYLGYEMSVHEPCLFIKKSNIVDFFQISELSAEFQNFEFSSGFWESIVK